MKKKIVSKLKKVFTQNNKKCIWITVGSILFVAFFWLFLNFFQKPISEEQFDLCKQVAQEVSMKLPSNIPSSTFKMDVTDDFSVRVELTHDSVRVSPSNNSSFRSDTVIGKFNDGTLVLERRDGTLIAVMLSTLFGLMGFILGRILVNKIYEILNADVTEATSE